jgi:polar amino acid transport system substrate-binding protein
MALAELLTTWKTAKTLALLGAGIGALAAAAGVACAETSETLRPGVLDVAIEPYMPYTGVENGELTGLDSDILAHVAAKLGLKIEFVVTDFPGMLASVQSHRTDITIGGIAWSDERQKVGLFTDPPYYSPPAMAVQGNESFSTVKSLEGKDLGTVTGYVWAKSIAEVPNATAHDYPSANGVFEDLAAGRIDVGFLDPLLIIYIQKQRPEMKFHTQYLTPPTAAEIAAHPDYKYFQPYMTGFYLSKDEPKLTQAISDQIDDMYKDGSLAALITKWGGDPKQFLVPSPDTAAQRQGVDRPASWAPPSIQP